MLNYEILWLCYYEAFLLYILINYGNQIARIFSNGEARKK